MLPEPVIHWVSQQRDAISISYDIGASGVQLCASEGIATRFNYTLKFCRRRSWWWDRCERDRTIVKRLRFDSFSSSHILESDELRDDLPAQSESFGSFTDAWQEATRLSNLSIGSLNSLQADGYDYLAIKIALFCLGTLPQKAVDLSSYISSSELKDSRITSRWIIFNLR
ncbi:MAG TPA: DUF4390 domain-containing protein [Oligoflexia bacterium]|nr:DUF4390 domain-containing protein [Oligoflexia bacterium]HMP27126.1 DUF4390 domain-containing protein [Oligoflexia bacterium]